MISVRCKWESYSVRPPQLLPNVSFHKKTCRDSGRHQTARIQEKKAFETSQIKAFEIKNTNTFSHPGISWGHKGSNCSVAQTAMSGFIYFSPFHMCLSFIKLPSYSQQCLIFRLVMLLHHNNCRPSLQIHG